MPCREVPRGPHENTRLFSAPMTPADRQRADQYMQRFREWDRNLWRWRAFWSGGAPYMVGPRPTRPGPPPAVPNITNVACQQAARVGHARIFADLEAALGRQFRCEGTCRGGHPCQKIFTRSRGHGYSLVEKTTYCLFTVRGRCGCPGEREPRVEA
ncbi:MAG: hypothetical protein WAO95_07605 [Burkholderiales bacterium]